MIYLRFTAAGRSRYGILRGKTVSEITPSYFKAFKPTGKKFSLSKVKVLAPSVPSKIIAMGLNYLGHIQEMKMPMPMAPVVFLKSPSAVIAHNENIVYPAMSNKVDLEAELAVIIKSECKDVSPANAQKHILGYTCFNDVTARDLQKADGQWARSKSFDTFAPVGPWIVDNIDPNGLQISSYVNGELKQRSNTSDLIFKVDEIVSFVSRVMTLFPGDIIATGTPSGVCGIFPGDEVTVKIEKIGALRNKVAK